MKKKSFLLFIALILIISIVNISTVYADKNPYKKTTQWGTNCTWYAWQQAHDKAGVSLPGWGNARTWYASAKKAGFEVGKTPKAKSIVVWEWDKYGHVGYVERVSGNKIYVWDSDSSCIDESDEKWKECNDLAVDEESSRACSKYAKSIACEKNASYWISPGDLIGYIYLDNIHKTTTTQKITTTTLSTTKTTITSTTPSIKMSNNAYLSELLINDKKVELKKEIFDYTAEVPYETESITITAKTEDIKAKTETLEEQKLAIGVNTIKVNVSAEDGTMKQYNLTITRKNEETQKTSNEKKKETKRKDYLLIGGYGLIFVGIALLILFSDQLKKLDN